MPLKNNVRQLLQDISEELCAAIAESPEVNSKLAELHAAGYSLNLLLDCRRNEDEGSEGSTRKLTAAKEPALLTQGELADAESRSAGDSSEAAGDRETVSFRINANDLAFLRSVGIDPTRPGRSRRKLDEPKRPGSTSSGEHFG